LKGASRLLQAIMLAGPGSGLAPAAQAWTWPAVFKDAESAIAAVPSAIEAMDGAHGRVQTLGEDADMDRDRAQHNHYEPAAGDHDHARPGQGPRPRPRSHTPSDRAGARRRISVALRGIRIR
jgi:hypothetical protein